MPDASMSFFQTPLGDLQIFNITPDQKAQYWDAMLDLYCELFPQYFGALSRQDQRTLLSEPADPRFNRHRWLVTWNAQAAGLVSFEYIVPQNLGVCLSIAIRPAYRSLAWSGYHRLSDFLIQQMIKQLQADAAGSAQPGPIGLVVEIETPESTTNPALKESRMGLFKRYREYGFLPLDVIYHEPAFVRHPENPQIPSEDAQPMRLCMLPLTAKGTTQSPQPEILNQVIDALLVNHYGLPENHWIIQQARNSMGKQG